MLTGQIQPNKKSKTTKEEAFSSWVEAIYEAASMNVVTVTRIDHDSRQKYDGILSRGRHTAKSSIKPNGFEEKDYKLCLVCSCTQFQRVGLVYPEILVTLNDMGKIRYIIFFIYIIIWISIS